MKKVIKDKNGELLKVYEYDEKGNIIYYKESGKNEHIYEYKYDDEGKVIYYKDYHNNSEV